MYAHARTYAGRIFSRTRTFSSESTLSGAAAAAHAYTTNNIARYAAVSPITERVLFYFSFLCTEPIFIKL